MIVYLVTNNISGLRYVGQTVKTAGQRWAGHIAHARTGRTDMPLLAAIREYGPAAFTVLTLEACTAQGELNRAERLWIDALGTLAPSGYNACYGIWRRAGQRAKISATLKGRVFTPSWRARIAAANRGRRPNEAQLAALAAGRSHRLPLSPAAALANSANNGRRVTTDQQVRDIRTSHAAGESQQAIADRMGIGQTTVSRIVRRVRLAHVPDAIPTTDQED